MEIGNGRCCWVAQGTAVGKRNCGVIESFCKDADDVGREADWNVQGNIMVARMIMAREQLLISKSLHSSGVLHSSNLKTPKS